MGQGLRFESRGACKEHAQVNEPGSTNICATALESKMISYKKEKEKRGEGKEDEHSDQLSSQRHEWWRAGKVRFVFVFVFGCIRWRFSSAFGIKPHQTSLL